MHGRELQDDSGHAAPLALALVAGGAVWAAVWGATAALFTTPLPPLAASMLFAAIALVALPLYARQAPRPRFGAANGITLFRAGLIAVVAGFAAEPPAPGEDLWWIAVAVAGTALLLDGVDGWVARRTAHSSAFGARFDMETDALAMLVLCFVLWRADLAGVWVLLLGAMRYLFVAAGWLFAWMRRTLPPSQRRRAICAIQGVLLVLALAPVLPAPLPTLCAAAALALTAGSFLRDTLWLWRRRRESV